MGENRPFTCQSGYVTKMRGSWHAVIPWFDAEGRRHRLVRTTGIACDGESGDPSQRGRRLAERELVRIREELHSRLAEEAMRSQPDAQPFVDWVEACIGSPRSQTRAGGTVAGDWHCHALLCRSPLADATLWEVSTDPVLVNSFFDWLVDAGYQPRTIVTIVAQCRHFMELARRGGYIDSNPFSNVSASLPRVRRRPVNYLDPVGQTRVLSQLEGIIGEPFARAAAVSLLTGLRAGEVCGLRWLDVDEAAGMIHVRGSISLASSRPSSVWMYGPPKTESSLRDVPMANALRRFLQLVRGDGSPVPDSYVIQRPARDGFCLPPSISARWGTWCRDTGLVGSTGSYLRFHDLRHSFAVNAIASGMDIETLARILGHARASMTLDVYGDALADSKVRSMERYDAFLAAAADKAALPPRGISS